MNDLRSLLEQVPQSVYVILAYILLKNFDLGGRLIQKLVDYQILQNKVLAHDEQIKVIQKDLNEAHCRIRDMQGGLK